MQHIARTKTIITMTMNMTMTDMISM